MAEKIKIFDVTIDLDAVVEDMGKLSKSVDDAKKRIKELEKAEVVDYKELAKAKAELKNYNSQLASTQKYYQNVIIAQNANTDSIEQARKALAVISVLWAKEASVYGENSEEAKKLAQKKLELTEMLKKEELATGDATRNVGNYKAALTTLEVEMAVLIAKQEEMVAANITSGDEYDALTKQINANAEASAELSLKIEDLTKSNAEVIESNKDLKQSMDEVKGSMDVFNGGLSGVLTNFINLSQQEDGLKKSMAAFTGGINSATKAALKFMATSLGLVLTGIVVALAAVKYAVSQNITMQEKLTTAWDVGTNSAGLLNNRIARTVGAFSNLFKLDFKAFKNEISDLWGNFVQDSKDVETLTFSIISKEKDLRVSQRESSQTQQQLNAELEKYNEIAGDGTKSLAEQNAAAIKAGQISKQLADERNRLYAKELLLAEENKNLLIKKRGELTQDEKDAYNEKLVAYKESNTAIDKAQREAAKRQAEIAQDIANRDLDILIDGFDSYKTAQEKIANDTQKNFEERFQALENVRNEGAKSFNNQVAIFQNLTSKQIDANDLLMESDAKVLNEKIKNLGFSDNIAGRMLEIIKERRMADSDYYEAYRDLSAAQVEESLKAMQNAIDAEAFQAEQRKKIRKEYNENQIAEDLTAAQRTYENTVAIAQKQLDAKLITENDFQAQRLAAEQAYTSAADELLQAEMDRKKEVAQLNYENELAAMEGNEQAKLSIQLEALEAQKQLEIQYAKSIGAETTLIEEKYATKQKDIKNQQLELTLEYETKQKDIKMQQLELALAGTKNFISAAQKLFKENTVAYKSMAAAQATIDTFASAQAAYKSVVGIYGVGPVLAPIAAAAAVVAGMINVKKILSTPTDGSGSSSSSSSSSSTSSTTNNLGLSAGAGIVSDKTTQTTPVKEVSPVLVVDSVTSAQKTQETSVKLATL